MSQVLELEPSDIDFLTAARNTSTSQWRIRKVVRSPAFRMLVCALLLVVAPLPMALSAPQKAVDRYDDTFRKYSKRYFGPGYDWRLFKAQAMAESGLDPAAKSWVGARGVMQLMPTTFQEIQSKNPEFQSIDDPVWNIAAGICYDRELWTRWSDHSQDGERTRFVLGSYNAGRRPLLRAQSLAGRKSLDAKVWTNLRLVADQVPNWRHRETFSYVDRIEANLQWMCDRSTAGSRTAKP